MKGVAAAVVVLARVFGIGTCPRGSRRQLRAPHTVDLLSARLTAGVASGEAPSSARLCRVALSAASLSAAEAGAIPRPVAPHPTYKTDRLAALLFNYYSADGSADGTPT